MSDAIAAGATLVLHRVGERGVMGGGVRVERVARRQEQRVGVARPHERNRVMHVPAARIVDAMREIRQAGDLAIMPVVEKVLAVERRPLLKEDLDVRRMSQLEDHVGTVVLRSQDARITRKPAGGERVHVEGSPVT